MSRAHRRRLERAHDRILAAASAQLPGLPLPMTECMVIANIAGVLALDLHAGYRELARLGLRPQFAAIIEGARSERSALDVPMVTIIEGAAWVDWITTAPLAPGGVA